MIDCGLMCSFKRFALGRLRSSYKRSFWMYTSNLFDILLYSKKENIFPPCSLCCLSSETPAKPRWEVCYENGRINSISSQYTLSPNPNTFVICSEMMFSKTHLSSSHMFSKIKRATTVLCFVPKDRCTTPHVRSAHPSLLQTSMRWSNVRFYTWSMNSTSNPPAVIRWEPQTKSILLIFLSQNESSKSHIFCIKTDFTASCLPKCVNSLLICCLEVQGISSYAIHESFLSAPKYGQKTSDVFCLSQKRATIFNMKSLIRANQNKKGTLRPAMFFCTRSKNHKISLSRYYVCSPNPVLFCFKTLGNCKECLLCCSNSSPRHHMTFYSSA
jgi:hypothetical protein